MLLNASAILYEEAKKLSFDQMAAAIDWLDAYRAGDLSTLLAMYADDAVIHCGCAGMKKISGEDALRAYWIERFREYPASDLADLQFSPDGVVVSYHTRGQVVSAELSFNAACVIKSSTCGPTGQAS